MNFIGSPAIFDGPPLPDSFEWKEPGTGDEPCEEGYQEVACSNFCGKTKEYEPPSKLRNRSFTSFITHLRQDINSFFI